MSDVDPALFDSDAETRVRSEPVETTATTAGAVRVGEQLGPYRLVEVLGEGGMARIFKAEGPPGTVALKVIPISLRRPDDPDRRRFIREGEVLERLEHPNVVRLLGRGEAPERGAAWLAFELLQGVDLDVLLTRLPQRRLSPPEVLFVLERCARALAATHAAGVLHRDLKASNVIVSSSGEVKLIDFGIALAHEASVRLTAAGHLVGTLPYIAPEVSGDGWTEAADLYALGCLGYKLLSGRPPFRFPDVQAFVDTHAQGLSPRPLEELVPGLPVDVVAVVEALLARDPAARPTAAQLQAQLASREHAANTERVAAAWQEGRLGAAFSQPDASLWNSLAGGGSPNAGPALGDAGRGRRIGPYVVERALGRGAMGEIYLVQHAELGQRYALKLLAAEWIEDDEVLARFEREMAALASVDGHPGIVRVHSAGRSSAGRPYFVMDYVEGATFRQAVQGGLTRDAGLDLIEQVAEALAFAHERGVVHRDVKPDNILLTDDGAARVTDFGLSKAVFASGRRLTRTGDVVGTPTYMAPEQVSPSKGEVGPWSDVFALGAMAWELFAGRPPFVGQTSVEIYTKLLEATAPPRFRDDDPAVEASLGPVLERALEPRTEKRFASAAEFRAALREARAALAEGGLGRRRVPAWLLGAASGSILLGSLAVAVAALRDPPEVASPRPTSTATAAPTPPPAEEPPADRARRAAWAGDRAACEAALGALASDHARALRWELWPWVGGGRPAAEDPSGGWGAVAAGEAALAAGALGLADVAFARAADDPEASPACRLAGSLGRARAQHGQGRLVAATASWRRAERLAEAVGGLAGARCAEVAALLWVSHDEPPAALRSADPTTATARAPGVRWAAGVLAARTGAPPPPDPEAPLLLQARAAAPDPARAGALLERLGIELGASFSAAERAALRAGAGGRSGPTVLRALTRAEAVLAGPSREGAAAALEALASATRLAPRSPAVWLARSGIERRLGRAARAGEAARRARALAPGDPAALSALAAAERARLDGARATADVAFARGAPDRSLERKLAAGIRSELEHREAALRAATTGARRDAPRARLALARAQAERAERLRRAGNEPEAAAARAAAHQTLQPLLPDPRPALAARSALAEAFRSGEPPALRAATQQLLAARASIGGPHVREARWLVAGLQLETVSRRASGALLAWGDREACVARALRRAERAERYAERTRLLDRAAALERGSPDLAFARACASFEEESLAVFGRGADALRDLARVVAGRPERTGVVVAGLRTRPAKDAEAAEAWGTLRPEEPLARALAAAQGRSWRWRWRAALEAARAVDRAQVGAQLLRVALLPGLAKGERSLSEERRFAADCALAAAPESALALRAALLTRPVTQAALDRPLAQGYLTNHRALDRELTGADAGGAATRLLGARAAGHVQRLDLASPAYTLGFVQALERERVYPRLALALRATLASRTRSAWEAAPLTARWKQLRELEPELADGLQALTQYELATARESTKELKALRPAALEAAARACAARATRPRIDPWSYRPAGAPAVLDRLLSTQLPAQAALARVWARARHGTLFVRDQLYAALRKRKHAPLTAVDLAPWGRGPAGLAAPLDWRAQRKLAEQLMWHSLHGEASLAMERAVLGAPAERRGSLAHTFAFWSWRWYGMEPRNPLEQRQRALEWGLQLAARAQHVVAPRQQRSLREVEGELSLDRAGLAAAGSAERRRWTARAARALEPRGEVDPGLDYAAPLVRWRRARLAAAQADAAAVAEAAAEAEAALPRYSAANMRRDFGHYFRNDPWDAALRRVPAARRFLERVLPKKPSKKP